MVKKRKRDLISEHQPDDGDVGSDEEFGWADDEAFDIHALDEQPAA